MQGKLSAVFVFIILLPVFSKAEDNSVQKATQIFNLIYNQQFNEATRKLEAEKKAIGTLYYGVLSIDLTWWRYISTRNPDDLAEFLERCNDSKGPDTGIPEDNITRLVGMNYLMRFEVKQGNLLKAGLLHLKIRGLLRQLEFKAALPEQTKLFKLYQYLFYYFEKKYIPFSANPEGIGRNRILEILNDYCADENLIVSSLSEYFLGKIYLEVEKKPDKASRYFRVLAQRFPSNVIFAELLRDSLAGN